MAPLLFLTSVLLAPPPLPALPAPVDAVAFVQPFTLEEPYQTEWRKDEVMVREGWLVVLRADAALLYPRQVEDAILFAGEHTVQRVNNGFASGALVAIVPASHDKAGAIIPLAETPIWFGGKGLPEQVDAARIDDERTAAERAGIRLLPPIAAEAAAQGKPLALRDRTQLMAEAAKLVDRMAPDESQPAVP